MASCSGSPLADREGDIEAVASDAALDATAPKFSELEERIEKLESTVSALEQRDNRLADYTEAVSETSRAADARQDNWTKTNHDRLYDNDKAFAGRLGLPFDDNRED